MKKLTFRQVQKALSNCVFHPNEPGPLKIIIDVNNPDFYELRAIESIWEARQIKDNLLDNPKLLEQYNNTIITAIQLLILAKETRNNVD